MSTSTSAAFHHTSALYLRSPSGFSLTCRQQPPLRMTVAPVRPVTLPKKNVVNVSPENGFISLPDDTSMESIAECYIELRKQKVYELDLESHRDAEAVIYARESLVDSSFTQKNQVIVFLHGFSQRPRNYASMLRFLAAQGFVVIAPRVWLFDTMFAKIEGAKPEGKWFASQPAKLQSALLIDTVRCVKWAIDHLSVRSVDLVAHSMGAAMALVAAQVLGTRISSVATLAPAVGPTEITPLNTLLSLKKGGDVDKFARLFKRDVPVLLVHGENDFIVKERDVDELFDAFINADRPDIVGDVDILNGSHVGFEDTLDIDVPIVRRLDWLFFKFVDLLVFGLFDAFAEGKERQLKYTKSLLRAWLETSTTSNANMAEISAKIKEIHGENAKVRWRS